MSSTNEIIAMALVAPLDAVANTIVVKEKAPKKPRLANKFEKYMAFGFSLFERLVEQGLLSEIPNHLLGLFDSVDQQTEFYKQFHTSEFKSPLKALRKLITAHNKPPKAPKAPKDPNAPKAERKPRAPKDPNAPPKQPKAPKDPNAPPKDPNAPKDPDAPKAPRKPRTPKVKVDSTPLDSDTPPATVTIDAAAPSTPTPSTHAATAPSLPVKRGRKKKEVVNMPNDIQDDFIASLVAAAHSSSPPTPPTITVATLPEPTDPIPNPTATKPKSKTLSKKALAALAKADADAATAAKAEADAAAKAKADADALLAAQAHANDADDADDADAIHAREFLFQGQSFLIDEDNLLYDPSSFDHVGSFDPIAQIILLL